VRLIIVKLIENFNCIQLAKFQLLSPSFLVDKHIHSIVQFDEGCHINSHGIIQQAMLLTIYQFHQYNSL